MSTITAAWREGRSQARQRRPVAEVLVAGIAALVGLTARLPLAALGAVGCVAGAGWHLGVTQGLIASALGLLFLEWRLTR